MISAKIILDSINPEGIRITTWELEYQRFIHAEFMTHRQFSRNAASSRAIPVKTILANIAENPAMPVYWGANQSGMQAKEELIGIDLEFAKETWQRGIEEAIETSQALIDAGLHKQISNRVTEPFQHIKVVMTSTEHNNWFWLRDHSDAQPEIAALAADMHEKYKNSKPQKLSAGQWHVPYVTVEYKDDLQFFFDEQGNLINTQEALMISISCCAQVSYRKSDTSLEKAETIYKRLIESEPCHSSPCEHQALVPRFISFKETKFNPAYWEKGITHIDREGQQWSGNFRGWIQNRQLIPNNVKKG